MGDRCTGACCRRFILTVSYARLQELAAEPNAPDDTKLVADMLIPLGESLLANGGQLFVKPREHFRCKHVQANGDCGIYDRRPQLCRGFPYGFPCEHGVNCDWDAARLGHVDASGSAVHVSGRHREELKTESRCVVPAERLTARAARRANAALLPTP